MAKWGRNFALFFMVTVKPLSEAAAGRATQVGPFSLDLIHYSR
jgi:hypothetical protein